MEYKLEKNYKHNNQLRSSFNKLANEAFGLDFEPWYQKGYWNEHYMPYSFSLNSKIIANVSANYMQLKLKDQEVKAIQIGTVVTDPEYRKRGFGKRLMEEVEKDFRDKVDFFYLFADESAKGFYEKCGYTTIIEKEYHLTINRVKMEALKHSKEMSVRKLDIDNKADYKLLQSLIASKDYESNGFGLVEDYALLNFYFLFVYGQCIYYDENREMILVVSGDKENITIHSIINNETVILDSVIDLVGNIYLEFINIDQDTIEEKFNNLKSINIEFKPIVGDESLIEISDYVDEDGATFIKMNSDIDIGDIRFPGLSHA